MTDNKMERYKVKKAIKDLVKNINETTHIPIVTEDDIFELFQLDSIADLRKVSRNFLKLSKILDYFSIATEIATSEKEGIVKFGIENGNAINAEAWKQAIGQTLGGYVSKVENKEAGKWYINDLTDGKIYKCIQSHRSTSFDITKFIDITNIGLSDKLENLYKVQQAKLYVHAEAIGQGRTTCNIVEKVGSIVTIIFDSGNALRNINDNTVIFQIPDGFKPKTFLSVNASQYNTSNGTVYIEPSGIGKWKGATVNSASIIFSVSYIV
jgi:hypothetical protein